MTIFKKNPLSSLMVGGRKSLRKVKKNTRYGKYFCKHMLYHARDSSHVSNYSDTSANEDNSFRNHIR